MIILDDDLDTIHGLSKDLARSMSRMIDDQIYRSLMAINQIPNQVVSVNGKSVLSSKYPIQWTTKDGRVLNIEEMGNNHLVNAIRFIEKKSWAIMKRPELLKSEYDFSKSRVEGVEMDRFLDENHLHMLSAYEHYRYMCEEAMDRRLEIPQYE